MNLKRSIYLPGNQLLNYISGRFNFDERRVPIKTSPSGKLIKWGILLDYRSD